jgi:hypothetical protein
VNANPSVKGAHVIRKMTKEAVHVLLQHHRFLTSGLNPDNLPNGLFLQRDHTGELVLCADPAVTHARNAFTLRFDEPMPVARRWDGDFRRFDIHHYMQGRLNLSDSKTQEHLLSFAALEPRPLAGWDLAINAFVLANPAQKNLIDQNKDFCLERWPLVLQIWSVSGSAGLAVLMRMHRQIPERSPQAALISSLHGKSADVLRDMKTDFTEGCAIALGQVYNELGAPGVERVVLKWAQIKNALGEEFFKDFTASVLNRCDNFMCFATPEWFKTMDEMMDALTGQAESKQALRQVWANVQAKHVTSVQWDNVAKLWKAFHAFTQELDAFGLKLKGNVFDGIQPNNMLVVLERVLGILKQLAEKEAQEVF